MKKVKIIGWMGMLFVALCVFASCSDKDEPQPEPTPDPTPEISEPPKATVSLQEFQEKAVGKFWHMTSDSWISSDGEEHDFMFVGLVGIYGYDKYDFSSNEKCDIYHNYLGTGLVPGKEWAYSTENYVYDEESGQIFFRTNVIPSVIRWYSSTYFIESLSDNELVIRSFLDWQNGHTAFEGIEAEAWQSYHRMVYTPCTPEQIAKYKEDFIYMEF